MHARLKRMSQSALGGLGADLVDVTVTVVAAILFFKLLLGAKMLVPLVVVISPSMTHASGDTGWSDWLQSEGMGLEQIHEFPLTSGFNMGDMIVVVYPNPKLGDVIIYERDREHTFHLNDPIIHRVVGIARVEDDVVTSTEGTLVCHTTQSLAPYADAVASCRTNPGRCPYNSVPDTGTYNFYITKGDANRGTDQCPGTDIANPVTDAQVLGRGILRLPYIGWLKILMNLILELLLIPF